MANGHHADYEQDERGDDAAKRTGKLDSRFFGGLGLKETAEVLQVSESTVTREWRLARAWLYRRLGSG